jgi:multidrug efflux pump subunit AcrA (membrane-fusion protein)
MITMIRSRLPAGIVVLALMAGLFLSTGITQTPRTETGKAPAKTAEPAKPADVFKVEKKPFKIEVAVKGNLEPKEAEEVYFRPEPIPNFSADYAPLVIKSVVAHGATVKKGDVLAAFDTRKLDLVIKDSQAEMSLLETSITLAQDELPLAAKSMPVEMAAAERAKKIADEDMKYFLETARPQSERSAHMMVKQSGFYLEYAKEELRQLEKMYKSKDLTEETEQIILKRQRYQVEIAQFFFKESLIDRDYTLKVSLPRKEKDLTDNGVQKELALEKARATLGPALAQKQHTLAKMIIDRTKLSDRLHKLGRDRERLTLRAPMDGTVYYGRLHQGQWTSASVLAGKLVPQGIVSSDETLMTVVKPRPLLLRLTIEEKDAYLIKPGLQGKVQVTFLPDLKLKASVSGISRVPVAPGQYEALVAVDPGGVEELMPGMACSVKFVPYSRKDALAVPATAVFEEDDKQFVTIVQAGGKKDRREVTTGKTANDLIEILTGLREGEEIVKDGAVGQQKK